MKMAPPPWKAVLSAKVEFMTVKLLSSLLNFMAIAVIAGPSLATRLENMLLLIDPNELAIEIMPELIV
jgi:hypothetical protein